MPPLTVERVEHMQCTFYSRRLWGLNPVRPISLPSFLAKSQVISKHKCYCIRTSWSTRTRHSSLRSYWVTVSSADIRKIWSCTILAPKLASNTVWEKFYSFIHTSLGSLSVHTLHLRSSLIEIISIDNALSFFCLYNARYSVPPCSNSGVDRQILVLRPLLRGSKSMVLEYMKQFVIQRGSSLVKTFSSSVKTFMTRDSVD